MGSVSANRSYTPFSPPLGRFYSGNPLPPPWGDFPGPGTRCNRERFDPALELVRIPPVCLVSFHTSQPHCPSPLFPSPPPIHAGMPFRFPARRSRVPPAPALFIFATDLAICAQGKQSLCLRVISPLIGFPQIDVSPPDRPTDFPSRALVGRRTVGRFLPIIPFLLRW